MAHSPETKAKALAMLMTGDAPQYVASTLQLPYSTVKRWQGEAFALWRDIIGPIDLSGVLGVAAKMDTKKKRGADTV